MRPENLRYLESHEWARQDGDLVTFGITDWAVEHLSDLVYIELPEVGAQLAKGKGFGEVESVKAVSELFAPVSGEVVEVNEELKENLDHLTSDPFGAGWMIKVRPSKPAEMDGLLDAEQYEKTLEASAE